MEIDNYIDKIVEFGVPAVMAFALLFLLYKIVTKGIDEFKSMHEEHRKEREQVREEHRAERKETVESFEKTMIGISRGRSDTD